jgi:hypothetical protein
MKIVYLVSEGTYGEYYLYGAFSSRELAEKYMSDMNMSDSWFNDIEELEIDRPKTPYEKHMEE